MFLSSTEIREAIKSKLISAVPNVLSDDFRPFGIRLRLGDELIMPLPSTVALDGSCGEVRFKKVEPNSAGYFEIPPRVFMLGASSQKFLLDSSMVGFIDGRSTVARLGLAIHLGSQIFDGASLSARTITFELLNLGPHTLLIKPGQAVGMLCFFRSSKASEDILIHDQYKDQVDGPLPPRIVGW